MNLESLEGKKISIICGGWSAEREISLKTGKAVFKALEDLNLDLDLIDIKSEKEAHDLDSSLGLAFIALHGRGGEDGFIQNLFEQKLIPYTGSNSSVCKLTMDKSETKKIWIKEGLLTPDFLEINFDSESDSYHELNFGIQNLSEIIQRNKPIVVKPCREGSSFGINIVQDTSNGVNEEILEARSYDNTVILEEFIEGTELTVPILDGKALTPISIKPNSKFYDYEAKYERKDTVYEASKLNKQRMKEVKGLALKAYSVLGCKGWARVDLIDSKEENFYLIEINTVPGLTNTSLFPKSAALEGISFTELVIRMLKTA